jgi:hypothetical protein
MSNHVGDEKNGRMDDATKTPLPVVDEDYFCPRCTQSMPAQSQAEHEDWHLATDLQSEEEHGSGATSHLSKDASLPPKHDLKPLGDNKIDKQPPQYMPPPGPPPRNGALRPAISARPHTNQVIEAAKVRARDEVCCATHTQRLTKSCAESALATNAKHAAERAAAVQHIQPRN